MALGDVPPGQAGSQEGHGDPGQGYLMEAEFRIRHARQCIEWKFEGDGRTNYKHQSLYQILVGTGFEKQSTGIARGNTDQDNNQGNHNVDHQSRIDDGIGLLVVFLSESTADISGNCTGHAHIKQVIGGGKASDDSPDSIPMIPQFMDEERHHEEGDQNADECLGHSRYGAFEECCGGRHVRLLQMNCGVSVV